MDQKDDFNVIVVSETNAGENVATVLTNEDLSSDERLAKWENDRLMSAIQKYDERKEFYSTYGKDTKKAEDMTLDQLAAIASDIHSNLDDVLRVNAIVRKYLVISNLVGRTYESLYGNINSDYRLYFPEVSGRNKLKQVAKAREIIEDFLTQIHIKEFIRDSIALTYLEGNRYCVLKMDGGNYAIDILPLGVCFVSDYIVNGEPSLAVNLKRLEAVLKKTYAKSKKNNKAVWMENILQEIKINYPYLYDGYVAGEEYVRLDPKFAKACRYNNIGRKYGVSPLAKVLPDLIVLDNIRKADTTVSKTKQRVIIAQFMREKVLGPDGRRKGLVETQYAHSQLMGALQTTASVYTANPAVDRIEYIQPDTDDSSDNKMQQYVRQVMVGLGIAYADPDLATTAAGKINIAELMKTVNSIADAVEQMLNSYFVTVLENNGIGKEYAPRIDVLDSEALDMAMRKDLASFVYNTLNGSAKTAFELVDVDYDTEVARRHEEKENGSEDILTPHPTSYTTGNGGSGEENDGGRPAAEDPDDPDKQSYDETRNGDAV